MPQFGHAIKEGCKNPPCALDYESDAGAGSPSYTIMVWEFMAGHLGALLLGCWKTRVLVTTDAYSMWSEKCVMATSIDQTAKRCLECAVTRVSGQLVSDTGILAHDFKTSLRFKGWAIMQISTPLSCSQHLGKKRFIQPMEQSYDVPWEEQNLSINVSTNLLLPHGHISSHHYNEVPSTCSHQVFIYLLQLTEIIQDESYGKTTKEHVLWIHHTAIKIPVPLYLMAK